LNNDHEVCAHDRGRIERHIKPLLGRIKVAAVTREDVETFMLDVAEGKTAVRTKDACKKRGLANVRGGMGTASRTVGLLGAIFSYAVRHRMRVDNPVHGIIRRADGRRDRRLSDAEYKALGKALRKAEATVWPAAVAAARFLTLTGWRSGEAVGLHWSEIDLPRRTALLGDTKTGRSMRPLSHAACAILNGLTRSGQLTFPATRGEGQMTGFPNLFEKIVKLGGLPKDITPHVLRHSYASLAADLGYSETDHCRPNWSQGPLDHLAVRAFRRRTVARRRRLDSGSHYGPNGRNSPRRQSGIASEGLNNGTANQIRSFSGRLYSCGD
jgi:integrase